MTVVVPEPEGFARFDFSTDSYSARERVEAWGEALGRHCGVRIDINPRSAEGFRSSVKIARSSAFSLIEGSTSPNRQASSRALLVNDDVTFASVMTSRWDALQLGRGGDLHPGDWSLLSNSDVSVITVPEESRFLAFSIPRAAIKPLVPDIGAMFACRIPASSPALQMLVRYLDIARRDNVVTTPELAAAFTDHVCDLLVLALQPTRDAAEQAKGRGGRAARLRAIKADVANNLSRPDLSIDAIATAHRITPRQVQRLFELDGTTFTEFVLRERLALAHRLLSAPGHLARPISAIALEAGFNDLSYFNRRFRQHYGCTPSDIRATGR